MADPSWDNDQLRIYKIRKSQKKLSEMSEKIDQNQAFE